ncbi:MAG TPA: DUF1579 family protein [Ohtaekwangia sp.]
MKHVFILIAFFLGTTIGRLAAQELGNKEKMKIFAGWEGHWQGEGAMQMGPGEPKKSKVDEQITYKLDGMVLLVEGLGKASDGSIVHQALGVISYDQGTNEYKFKTYLRDGKSGDAWLKPTGENKFQWGLDIPGRGKIRYSINIDTAKKTWNEIGEFSQDGTTWMKFFEMSLTKVE